MLSFDKPSADKLITFGTSAATAAALYYIGGQQLPTKALCATLGGVTASTLFQAYYPENCSLIREKCGENVTWVITWLYPGVIFAAGYLGGLPNDINLYVTSTFFYIQHVVSIGTWKQTDECLSKEVKSFCKQAEPNIIEEQLDSAGQLLDQVAAVRHKRVNREERFDFTVWRTDDCKKELSKAYLGLSTPKLDEAERWARCIQVLNYKLDALETLLSYLIENKGEESKVLELLKEFEGLAKPDSTRLLKLQFRIAVQYNKPEILEAFKRGVSSMEGTFNTMRALLSLIEQSIKLEKPEVSKICIQKAEELVDKLRKDDSYFPYYSSLRSSFSYRKSSNREEPESDILFNLTHFAAALKEWDKAEELLKNGKLKGSDRIFAEIEVGCVYGAESAPKAKEHFAKASELIADHSFPAGMADRELKIEKFRQDHYESLITAQKKVDLEGAYETAQKLTKSKDTFLLKIASKAINTNEALAKKILAEIAADFASLSSADCLELLRLQAEVAPEALFATYGDVKEEPKGNLKEVDRGQALLILAKARLIRKEYVEAGQILEEVGACVEKQIKEPPKENRKEEAKKQAGLNQLKTDLKPLESWFESSLRPEPVGQQQNAWWY